MLKVLVDKVAGEMGYCSLQLAIDKFEAFKENVTEKEEEQGDF